MAQRRWLHIRGGYDEDQSVDDFLSEIEKVCRKHGKSIRYDEGGFIITQLREEYVEHFNHAMIGGY